MIRLMIIDDHPMFRSGLKKMLHDEPDFCVVDEAGDWADGLARLRSHGDLDILLLDINLPARSGFDLLETIQVEAPELKVIMLSMYSQQQYALRALRAGAHGYVAKDMEAADLIGAVRMVAKGQKYMTPAVTEMLISSLHGPDDNPGEQKKLSIRESQIFDMLVRGESLTMIAAKLSISVKTVSTYRSRILEKRGVSTNAELIQYAVRNKLID
ncbi:response regulator transcription factor [Noviherbaspirillum sp. CPCC 100848]|uniref:Response regulator transcription factor n=1 Tax=Noviherbaspirillum album TaxID=3080276 RepID=A0ABU6JHV3_9BURK|nr:response regulator transcription factor [Noviherbaspirillum sp. CPCC 100848]MEC4723249.1 response regulator transcription factor [Noviherbaspirillum sp. CPCC 100848]